MIKSAIIGMRAIMSMHLLILSGMDFDLENGLYLCRTKYDSPCETDINESFFAGK